ncbi:MAG: aminomethyl-transferring glycine dehydrogenase subunit GcvPA [Methanobacteriota archaeon]|nr:MAG: aminomethyl-transferring glycine dehydrogenase subunit GcvPA [Euryarchaeota archaeon]
MPSDEAEMLREMGLRSVDDLFVDIPAGVRIPKLDVPDGLSEDRVVARVTSMLGANRTVVEMPTFLGGGLYDHFIPASVRAIVSRSEFYTSYTPYQPEISQGLLQALWEYQSLICELTGMDAANTSMYDGSTALGEAARMAHRIHGGRIFLVPRALRHNRRAVLANYVLGTGIEVREVDYDRDSGMLDLAKLKAALSPDVCGVYVENPNFFGRFEEQLEEIRAMTNGVLVVGVNPIAQAVVRPPGDFGADIVVGEGQPLGTQMNFGGPLLGIFACRQAHIRKMPGRVIGLTRDAKGHRAFCMTLQTREQHIRREKAMSNICTNESLLAVAAAAYMAVLGSNGIRRVAAENIRRARELAKAIDAIDGFEAPLFHGAHFNEFVVRRKKGYAGVHRALLEKGIHGGLPLTRQLPELSDSALFATTGRHTPEAVQRLIAALEGFR